MQEHDFTALTALPAEFQWLRTPFPDRLFHFGSDGLRMIGRESIGAWFEQSLIARRQCESRYRAQTTLRADPPNYQRAAGLVTYYNRHKFHAAWITRNSLGARVVQIVSCLGDHRNFALTYGAQAIIPEGGITLAVQVDGARQQFFWGTKTASFSPIGAQLDASVISDEGGVGEHGSFTGAFVGMFAMDMTGQGWGADFLRFAYDDS